MAKLPEMTAQEFGDIRQSLGFTQEKMAEAMGVDIRTVRRWENAERSIPGTAVILAKILVQNLKE
jgi:DNA-binding transcriptional regulator YiaG